MHPIKITKQKPKTLSLPRWVSAKSLQVQFSGRELCKCCWRREGISGIEAKARRPVRIPALASMVLFDTLRKVFPG